MTAQPLGLRDAWGWYRIFSLGVALGSTAGFGAIGALLAAAVGWPREALFALFAAIALIGLLIRAGMRLEAQVDALTGEGVVFLYEPANPFMTEQEVQTQGGMVLLHHWLVGVRNNAPTTVEDVRVLLERVEPPLYDDYDLPLPLKFKLDPPHARRDSVRLHPRETVYVLVAGRFLSSPASDSLQFETRHWLRPNQVSNGPYVVHLGAYAGDTTPATASFHVDVDANGRFVISRRA